MAGCFDSQRSSPLSWIRPCPAARPQWPLRAAGSNPTDGIFLSKDPVLGVLGGQSIYWNSYAYVHNNPVNLTDPSGEFIPLLLGALIIGGITAGAWNVFVEQGVGVGGRNQGRFDCLNLEQVLSRVAQGAEIGLNIGVGIGISAGVRAAGYIGLRALAAIAARSFAFGVAWDLLLDRPLGVSLITNFIALGFGAVIDLGGLVFSRVWSTVVGRSTQNSVKSATGTGGWVLPPEGGGAYIDGRWYTEHALERIAPKTPEVMAILEGRAVERAAREGLQPGTREYWMWWQKNGPSPRSIPPSVVEAEIANPGTTNVTVHIDAQSGHVITVIPHR